MLQYMRCSEAGAHFFKKTLTTRSSLVHDSRKREFCQRCWLVVTIRPDCWGKKKTAQGVSECFTLFGVFVFLWYAGVDRARGSKFEGEVEI